MLIAEQTGVAGWQGARNCKRLPCALHVVNACEFIVPVHPAWLERLERLSAWRDRTRLVFHSPISVLFGLKRMRLLFHSPVSVCVA